MDNQLSKLKRDWESCPSKQAELLYYQHCLKVEVLDLHSFRLAALCGHETAKTVLKCQRIPVPSPAMSDVPSFPVSMHEFYEDFEQFGRSVCLIVLLETLRNCEIFWVSCFPGDKRFTQGMSLVEQICDVKDVSSLTQITDKFLLEQMSFIEDNEAREHSESMAVDALNMLVHFILIARLPEERFFCQRETTRFFSAFTATCELNPGLEIAVRLKIRSCIREYALDA